jgi:hypothetical protein
MKSRSYIVPCLFTLLVVAGCASTKVTSRNQLVTGQLPRPAHIWVYTFAATPSDVPADSALAGQQPGYSPPQTAEDIETGRRLGAQIAVELVAQINAMGMPAELGMAETRPQINDFVIRGYLLSVDEGSAGKRVAIGFGSGASQLEVAVEGLQMTAQGLRKLGSGTTASGGSKGPGGVMGVAALVATRNPAGLIIGTGVKVYKEKSGSSKVEGRAKDTAKEIADVLKQRFQEEGWI